MSQINKIIMANPQYYFAMGPQTQMTQYDPNQQLQYPYQYQHMQGTSHQMQPIGPIIPQPQPILPIPINNYPNYQSQQDPINSSQQTSTAVESEWKTIQNKKRLRSPEEPTTRKQTKITEYWLQKPIETNNRFKDLMEEEVQDRAEEIQEDEIVKEKPPPITVYKVGYVEHIHKILQAIAPNEYTLKTIGPETVKIQLTTPEQYSTTIKALDEKNTQYHTYRLKSEKSFRVVMRGMHPSTPPEDIKKALKEKEHEVLNTYIMKDKVTKTELPLWFLDLKPNENNKEIYNLTKLENSIVKFEPPHSKRIIPQCLRCQEYGHTKNYCRKTTRCVKCAGLHATKECERRARDDKVRCANCNGNHPANYRGCTVHKQLQQKLYPTLRERNTARPSNTVNQQIQPGITYAQAYNNTRSQIPDHNEAPLIANQQTTNISKLEDMLAKIMEQMGTMLNLLTTVISKLA